MVPFEEVEAKEIDTEVNNVNEEIEKVAIVYYIFRMVAVVIAKNVVKQVIKINNKKVVVANEVVKKVLVIISTPNNLV